MAAPINLHSGRPHMPDHHSFHDDGDLRRPSMANDTAQPKTYEGYSITPNESEYDESRGKWYRALTKPMPGSQREFENLIRRQSLSDETVMEVLYSPRMMGSKREHIENYINAKDAANPGWKHELAYLKLERFPKHKLSRQSSKRTASMQIVLECKPRPRNNVAPMHPHASYSSSAMGRDSSSTNFTPTRTQSSALLTAPVDTSPSRYLPPNNQPGGTNRNSNFPNAKTANRRDGRDPIVPPLTPASNEYKRNGAEEPRSLSPCSTVSSNTVSPLPRNASNSSMLFGNTPAASQPGEDQMTVERSYTAESRDNARQPSTGHANPQSETMLSNPQRLHTTTGTHTDVDCLTDNPPFDTFNHPEPGASPQGLAANENSCSRDHAPSDDVNEEKKAAFEDGRFDHPKRNMGGSFGDTIGPNLYEKPVWMNNLQPVATPKIDDKNADPLDHPDDELAADHKANVLAEVTSRASSLASKENAAEALDRADSLPTSSSHTPRPIQDRNLPASTSSANPHHAVNDGPTIWKGPIMSEPNLQRVKDPRPGGRYVPPKYLSLDTKNQPIRQPEETSPKQRKRVTFSLPSPVSTVASTPVTGTPSSSPDTASSSSSEYMLASATSKWAPDATTPSQTTCRPPLHRSSHSSSSHMPRTRSYEPSIPRSTSYVDPPTKSSSASAYLPISERTTSSFTAPTNKRQDQRPPRYNRYHPEVVDTHATTPAKSPEPKQAYGRVMYHCEIDPCPHDGSVAFDSKAAFDAHKKEAHRWISTSHSGWRR